MTQEEATRIGNDKLKAIETLCRQLQVTISAEQTITNEGFIKTIVLYSDNERYDIEDQKKDEKTIEKPADLREEDTPDSV